MKTGEDFRREFPEVEEGFQEAVDNALQEIDDKVYGTTHKLRFAVLMTAVLLLLGSVGVAATIERWGVKEFTERSARANLSDEAIKTLATDFDDIVVETDHARLTITEAVYDGMAVYMLIEAVPNDPADLIVPTHGYTENMASSFSRGYPHDVSIEAYAAQLGYDHVLVQMCSSRQTTAHYYDSAVNEDGSVSMMLWCFVKEQYQNQSRLEMDFNVYTEHDNIRWRDVDSRFVLHLAEDVEEKVSIEGECVTFENAGVTVTGLRAVRTPMSTYIIADYDVIDPEKYQSYMSCRPFYFTDEDGGELVKGAYPLSYYTLHHTKRPYAFEPQNYYITNCLFDAMPAQITIGEYDGNCEDGWTAGKTYTFHLE